MQAAYPRGQAKSNTYYNISWQSAKNTSGTEEKWMYRNHRLDE